jgi:hypothetical protein
VCIESLPSAANARASAIIACSGETVTAATARFNHMLQERAREKDGGRENFQGVAINKRKVKSGY